MSSTGSVFLVGAGPGDAELVTIKAVRLVQTADVIVYDRLGAPELLKYAPADAELIDVGKEASNHTMKQEDICALLAAKAKEGKSVVRLKGGDPLIFGRGTEEARFLVAEGVKFEIVPGITSAAGAAACTGVALTERNKSTSITLITGHENPDKPASTVNWAAHAKTGGTLVIYMGMSRIKIITEELMRGGMSPETPVAVIHRATTPEQRELRTNIKNAASDVSANDFKAPSLIMVGPTAANEAELSWFAALPLFGKRILVTRSREQSSNLSDSLTQLGVRAIELPTISIEPAEDFSALDAAITNLSLYDYIVFTSTNAVKYFKARLDALGFDARHLAGLKIAAVGQVTVNALAEIGLNTDITPHTYNAEGVLAALEKFDMTDKKVLIPRARVAREIIPETLKSRGASVEIVETYVNVVPTLPDDKLPNSNLDLITFASSSTVKNFVSLVGDELTNFLKIPVASIGPITSRTARECGFNVVIEPPDATINSLIETISKYFGGK